MIDFWPNDRLNLRFIDRPINQVFAIVESPLTCTLQLGQILGILHDKRRWSTQDLASRVHLGASDLEISQLDQVLILCVNVLR